MSISIRPAGDSGWLLLDDDENELAEIHRRLAAAERPEIRDLVPAARSLLVVLDDGRSLTEAEVRALLAKRRSASAGAQPRVVDVAVRYDGEDLDAIAEHAGLSVEEVVARHLAAAYRVSFIGFQPGFPYLRGLLPELATPRRASPRPRVPAGSVAIGGGWCGIYPAATPGGWNLLGTATVTLFDRGKDPPTLLQAGDTVRFVRE